MQPGPIKQNDEPAFDVTALFKEHGDKVARWAARLGGPGIDVEDAVQEVFMVAGRRLGDYDGEAKITTWLFRTTERVVKASQRKARLHRRWSLLPAVFARALVAPPRDPTAALDEREAAATVYGILDRLPENQRRVLIMFQMEELSTDEIAQLLQANPATVRVWLHRARVRFAQLYQHAHAEETSPSPLAQERS